MNIFVRADASIHIGSGHVMRCLVLADRLRANQHIVTFVCRPQRGDLICLIESYGFEVIKLKQIENAEQPKFEADYLSWLLCSIDSDAREFTKNIEQADLVITDHYAIGQQWQTSIKGHLNCKVFAIDDLVREHDADLVLDQTLGRSRAEYKNCRNVLAGSHYALLKPQFSKLRESIEKKQPPKDVAKVMVSMGGIDNPNATLAVIKALSSRKNTLLTVLLSPNAPHYQVIKDYCAKYIHMEHFDFIVDMACLMDSQDVAIGAPGSTSWERACLGLPSIVIPLADNQINICNQLTERGACIKMAVNEIEEKLNTSLDHLLENWITYHIANQDICDGKGVFRVVQAIENICL